MTTENTLQEEVLESQRRVGTAEGVYKRDLVRRSELIKCVFEQMKDPQIDICELMELKMSNIILEINQTHDIIEADKLHSDLGIMDWLFYQVCKDQQKKLLANI